MKILLTALILSTSAPWLFAETNQFYITDDFVTHQGDTLPFTPEHIEKARHTKECRPAQQDPEGHWGPVTEGFQLSIRLQKDTFTNGEPVKVCVILRNVSGKLLRYFSNPIEDPMSKIVLMRGQQRLLGNNETKPGATFPERLKYLHSGSLGSLPSPVGTQRKFLVELSKMFDLGTNGEYVVQALRIIPSLDLKSEKEVASGKAAFRITNPASPAAPH